MPDKTFYGEFDYSTLSAFTAQLDDLERVRTAVENRHRILTTPADKVDKDGIKRGFGLPADDLVIVGPVAAVLAGAAKLEEDIIKAVERYMRRSPWGPWLGSADSTGVGAKQLARLLGAIGDPYWHSVEDRPRIVSELWSYCGYGVVNGEAPKLRRGQSKSDKMWSPVARTRARLIAAKCVEFNGSLDKNGNRRPFSPYRTLYDFAKDHYADAVHDRVCVQCGPSGKPAPAGSPLSDGHRHERAIRWVAKKGILKDLWIEARRQHGVTDLEAVA